MSLDAFLHIFSFFKYVVTSYEWSKTLISFAKFLLLIALNIEDPIKPQPIIEIVSNIKNLL